MQVTNSSSSLFASWEGADSQAAAPQQDLAAGAAGQDTAPGFPGTLVGYNKPLLLDDSPILTAGHTKPLQVSDDTLILVGHNKPLLLDTTPGTTAGSTATPPNADPMEIAALELLLAESANQDMVQHFGGPLQPLPTGTAVGQGIQARYGADLGARLNQLQTAQQAVREEYRKAVDNAAPAPGPNTPGSVYVPEVRVPADNYQPARWDFDPVAFTQHYASGGSPAQKAFAQLHGSEPLYFKPSLQDYETPGDYVRNGERGQYVLDDPLQPTFRLSATDDTELINKENLWFDPVHGWTTDEDNLKGDWIDKLSPVLMGGFLAFCTGGALSSLMGPASSAAGSIAQSAAIGASSSAVIQLVTTGKLDFGNMLRSALTAGVTSGIMDASGMGDMLKAQDLSTRMTAHLGKAGMQGVLQQAIGGKFKDGFANSLLSSAASEVGAHLDQQIKAQLPELDPAQASALKLLSRAATSALRIAGSNDPAASFANDFLMGALQDAAADRKRGQEGREGQEDAQDKPEGSTASSGLGLKPPRDWVDRLGRSEVSVMSGQPLGRNNQSGVVDGSYAPTDLAKVDLQQDDFTRMLPEIEVRAEREPVGFEDLRRFELEQQNWYASPGQQQPSTWHGESAGDMDMSAEDRASSQSLFSRESMNSYWAGDGLGERTMRMFGNWAYDAAQALAPNDPTPQELQRGRELGQIRHEFEAAMQAGDIPRMQSLQTRHAELTSVDGTPSLLQVSMASAIVRAQLDAGLPVDREALDLAATAAVSAGVSGMVSPGRGISSPTIHPQTGNPILAQVEYGRNIDFLVEGAKPSAQGRRIEIHSYENPGHHDIAGGREPYNPSKSVLPPNHVQLFEQSKPFINDDGRIVRFAIDEAGVIHQFYPTQSGLYHWSGSTNGLTASGNLRPISVPPEVRRTLNGK